MPDDARMFPPGTRVEDLDLSGVHLHGADLEAARLTDAHLEGASITGTIGGLVVNGVEVEPLVRAELERRTPERALLRAEDVATLREAWSMLEARWSATTARALRLPAAVLSERVEGEWSFLETLRHLVTATDCWVARGIHGVARPYHPWGLLWGGAPEAWVRQMGVDPGARPTPEEVLAMRADRQASVRDTLATLTDAVLDEVRPAPDREGHPSGEHSVRRCLHVVLHEEWQHHAYATRDLDVLDPAGAAGAADGADGASARGAAGVTGTR